MTGGKCAEQCDAVDCFEAATKAIIVSAGKFGIINLNLCHKCALKFQTTANPTTRKYFENEQLRIDKAGNNRADDSNEDITTDEQAKQKTYDSYPQAILCTICGQIVIAELHPISRRVTLYDFESDSMNRKVVHEHPADAITTARVTKRVAAENRLLEDPDPNDWVYLDIDNREEDTTQIDD